MKHRKIIQDLYDKAGIDKLLKMFDKGALYNTKSDEYAQKSESIFESIESAVKKKLGLVDDKSEEEESLEHISEKQFDAMVKLWNTTAASMVLVKRSIRLPRFYTRHDKSAYMKELCVSQTYGIKEYRRYTNYSPFGYNVTDYLKDSSNIYSPFTYKADRLHVNFSDNVVLDFVALQSISQLDQEKVILFMKITQDIVHMANSWGNYYRNLDEDKLFEIEEFMGKDAYEMREETLDYRKKLLKINEMIAYRRKTTQNAVKQAARWQPTIDKWREINKNFLVLSELKQEKLKV